MSDDTIDLKKERETPFARSLMKQFLNTDGPKGNNPAYDRGYEFNFRFSEEKKKAVLKLMDEDKLTFEEAFDYVRMADLKGTL